MLIFCVVVVVVVVVSVCFWCFYLPGCILYTLFENTNTYFSTYMLSALSYMFWQSASGVSLYTCYEGSIQPYQRYSNFLKRIFMVEKSQHQSFGGKGIPRFECLPA